MKISLIVAVDSGNGIGRDNQLPWHLPADLKHFKNITTGHPVIMGRKTFESIGKALPKRRNIVISRSVQEPLPGISFFRSLEEAFADCENEAEVFVIGGAQIFKECMDQADYIYLTRIHHEFQADTFFPELSEKDWKEISREDHNPDEQNKYAYTFLKYIRA